MNDSLQKQIGKAARKARVELEMTQEDAAEKIGVTVEFYARIERGNALPGRDNLFRMAVAFQSSLDGLVGLDENESAQHFLKEYALKQPKDPPELRRLIRKLRTADIESIRFMNTMYNELEKLYSGETTGKKTSPRRKARSKSKARSRSRSRPRSKDKSDG